MRITITGQLLDTTRETGSFVPPGESEERSWDFTQLHVLQGREVVKVRLPKGVHTTGLKVHDTVTLECDIAGTPKLTADLGGLKLGGRESSAA